MAPESQYRSVSVVIFPPLAYQQLAHSVKVCRSEKEVLKSVCSADRLNEQDWRASGV
jgi:hypothetical protein